MENHEVNNWSDTTQNFDLLTHHDYLSMVEEVIKSDVFVGYCRPPVKEERLYHEEEVNNNDLSMDYNPETDEEDVVEISHEEVITSVPYIDNDPPSEDVEVLEISHEEEVVTSVPYIDYDPPSEDEEVQEISHEEVKPDVLYMNYNSQTENVEDRQISQEEVINSVPYKDYDPPTEDEEVQEISYEEVKPDLLYMNYNPQTENAEHGELQLQDILTNPSRVLSIEPIKVLREIFPGNKEFDPSVDEIKSDDLVALSPPALQRIMELDPFDFQVFGSEEDKCLPKIELPFLDGPCYEPVIVPHPKSSLKYRMSSSSSARTREWKRHSININEEFSESNLPEDDQENKIVTSRTIAAIKRSALRLKKLQLKEQENDARQWQRQEVVLAKNLRPRVIKSKSPYVYHAPWEPRKPKRISTKRKSTANRRRGRPRNPKNQASSTPLSVKVENWSEDDELDLENQSPLTVSPIKLIRRLSTPYRSTVSVNNNEFHLPGISSSQEEIISSDTTPTQPEVSNIKSEPEMIWLVNPKSSAAKPAEQLKKKEANTSENQQRSKLKTEPTAEFFGNTTVTKSKTPTQLDSIKIETKTPIRRTKRVTRGLTRNMNSDSSTISDLGLIKLEITTPFSESSRETSIKKEIDNLIPNPKNKWIKTEIPSWLQAPRRRVRYAKEEYFCKLCEYKCTVETALSNHITKHMNYGYVKPMYSCEICGFDNESEMDSALHMFDAHKVGFDYQCDLCTFTSGQLKKLVQHRRKHTQERPHVCTFCNYRSTRRDNLHSHARRIHHIPRMEGDTFTQPYVNWEEVAAKHASTTSIH